MRDPKQVKADLVRQCSESAREDLRLAEPALAADYEGFAPIGFHAQQATETLMEARLVAHGVHPPSEHPIENLRAALRPVDPDPADAPKAADELTPYAVRHRYPPHPRLLVAPPADLTPHQVAAGALLNTTVAFGCQGAYIVITKPGASMKTRIVRIGNSQGVRIPKPLLEQSGLGDEVELELEDGRIIIRPAARPRQGWEQAFRDMAEQGDDSLLDPDLSGSTAWDENEWEW